MRAAALIAIASAALGSIAAWLNFIVANGRFPAGGGELANWLLGLG